MQGPTLDQKIGMLLLRLATTQRDAERIALALETESDPSETIGKVLYKCRRHLGPAMMPGYRRSGTIKKRLR